MRTKLRRSSDGAVIDKTFRAGEKFRAVRTESRKMQFLYADGTDAHFMDTESYEQLAIPEAALADTLRWTKPNDEVDVLFIDGSPADLQLPSAVDLEVTETEPGAARRHRLRRRQQARDARDRRDRRSVPLFVNIGDARARRHPLGRVRLACVAAERTEQRRAAVFALYQHDVTGRAARRHCCRATRAPFTRALAHAARRAHARSSTR